MPSPTLLRNEVAALVGEASDDLDALWRSAGSARQVEEVLRDILPDLIAVYGGAAATVAADWYDDLRAEREVRGRFAAITADIAETGSQALVGWALTEARDLSGFQGLILGGTQKRIASFARQTVTGSSIADPQASGWQRQAFGSCNGGFCDMLAGRGAVYSEASADFAAHDNCRCVAVPAFEGQPRPVKPFTPTNRNITDADRARVRDWIASH